MISGYGPPSNFKLIVAELIQSSVRDHAQAQESCSEASHKHGGSPEALQMSLGGHFCCLLASGS